LRSIWVAIHPRPTGTRVLVQAGPGETLLKARLAAEPTSPRALSALLEALALWQGAPIRAALCVEPDAATCATSSFLESVVDLGKAPLYAIEVVEAGVRRRRRDGLDGMGDFRDLRQLLLFEVAR
jgi:hypothetical protein